MIYYCWPVNWREAAIKAGLAERTDYGSRIYGGDEMRDKLAIFAQQITGQPSTAGCWTAPSNEEVGQGEVAPPKLERFKKLKERFDRNAYQREWMRRKRAR